MGKTSIILIVFITMASFCFAVDYPSEPDLIPPYLIAQNTTTENYGRSSPLQPVRLSYNDSVRAGRQDAEEMHSSAGYFLGGVGAGLLLGLIGTVIIGVSAGGSQPDFIPENVDSRGYLSGYYKKAKSKNQGAAWGGGLLGTAVWVGIVIAANSGS